MLSYKIYLTKSHEAAVRIANSFSGNMRASDIKSVTYGKVDEDTDLVPAVYHGKGYLYCAVTLGENGENDAPVYELTIC